MTTWHIRDNEMAVASRPLVMGIVNVTPDSFSDGGNFADTDRAIAHGIALQEQGADLIDIGGESTRPGATPVSADEELRRILPVVKQLARDIEVPISIDTSKARVADECLRTGASIINDVTALTGDPDMASVARDHRAGVILMHMQGTPANMQDAPHYQNVVEDLLAYFDQRVKELETLGLDRRCMVIDPGIGFGKTLDHTLDILRNLQAFGKLGLPVCLGVSRKGFIGQLIERPRDQRLVGSLAVLAHAMAQKAVHIVRVHDVGPTCDLVRMWAALEKK